MREKQTTDVGGVEIALGSGDDRGFRLFPDKLLVVGSELSTEGEGSASERGIDDENVGVEGLGAEGGDTGEEGFEERRGLEQLLETLEEERELAGMRRSRKDYPEGGVIVITLL